MSSRFQPVSPRVNFAQQETEVLSFWEKEKIFSKSVAQRDGAKHYVFMEGPPTANGMPGIHHVLARAFKDLWPRFKTMQGYLVERKAGWDTHGLPVEIEVEKKLGLKNKADIEKYGIAPFNAQAKESVWKYLHEWEEMTKRMGFWVDLENPYVTYEPQYIESLWWIIKNIWDKGLMYQGHKVIPYCPRCGTGLSSHEVAQGYKEVTDTSVFVKFKLKNEPNTYVLAWTTTPWTLPGNVALAVGNKISYSKVKVKSDTSKVDEVFIIAKDRVQEIFGDAAESVGEVKGKDLVGLEYEPLFAGAIPADTDNLENAFKIYPADFVTTEDGTGVVHTAVMYGEDDYQLGTEVGLPKYHTVDKTGRFVESVKGLAGMAVKADETEKEILSGLGDLVFKTLPFKHEYPFCWRCDSALMYYASASWFINMQAVKNKLVTNNQQINWIPEHIKDGRFGEWLAEVKDWAFSRERYWGTPLPIWQSEDGDSICIGSFEELKSLAKDKKLVGKDFDPHKPFVDEVILVKDGKEYTRVPEVCDVWFDSGCVPFAQWHYPFENQERIDGSPSTGSGGTQATSFPADFISEAVDQTRGWFYTLLAVSTLLGHGIPYKNVISLGHILDKSGKKMSKSKGNVVDPNKIFDSVGADALRWYLYTINQPGVPKNFDENGVTKVVQRFMLTLWNTYSFFVTYANIDGFEPTTERSFSPKNVLDKWIAARMQMTVATVTEKLEAYDPLQATFAMEKFLDDLSNWYVRRSRRRFWKGENDDDKREAYLVLYNVLKDFVKLLAPFMPFVSEAIYRNLRAETEPMSVHLADWPVVTEAKSSSADKVIEQMVLTREMVEVGLNQREEAGIKVRQPLTSFASTVKDLPAELVEIVTDELNVKAVTLGAKANQLDTKITSELATEGLARELVRTIQILRKESGLAIEDRISLAWASDDEAVVDAFAKWSDYIQTEVLAEKMVNSSSNGGTEMKVDQYVVKLGLKKI